MKKVKQVDGKKSDVSIDTGKSGDTSVKSVFTLSPLSSFIFVIFIYFAAQIFAVYVIAALGALQGKSRPEIVEWLSDSLYAKSLLIVTIVLIIAAATKALLTLTAKTWKDIGFTKIKSQHFGQALIGYGWYFLIFISVTLIARNFIPQLDLDQQQQLGFDRLATGASLWIIGFCLVILPAFYEEVLMRGVFFTGLRSKLSFYPTLIIISLVFGAAHLEWLGDNPLNWAAAIDTFALSIVLVYLRENSKSLWPAIFLHGLKNLVAFTIVFVFKLSGI